MLIEMILKINEKLRQTVS